MKFVIVRSVSILALLVERSGAPPRLLGEARELIDQVTQKIAKAQDLETLRTLDVDLQGKLRALIGAFRRP